MLVYFAHRIPAGASGPADQAAFVSALSNFLIAGGGIVSFHHGAYLSFGQGVAPRATGCNRHWKASPGIRVEGQNVINVAGAHFVTTHEVEYSGSVAYADPARGIPADTYDFFNNLPVGALSQLRNQPNRRQRDAAVRE